MYICILLHIFTCICMYPVSFLINYAEWIDSYMYILHIMVLQLVGIRCMYVCPSSQHFDDATWTKGVTELCKFFYQFFFSPWFHANFYRGTHVKFFSLLVRAGEVWGRWLPCVSCPVLCIYVVITWRRIKLKFSLCIIHHEINEPLMEEVAEKFKIK